MHLRSVTSTQEVARDLPLGSVVVAEHQTAGRGRLDRRWEAPPGTALLASFVLEPRALLSLAAGVAAAEACGGRVRLKWPNDLMLGERKLGGILVEVSGARADSTPYESISAVMRLLAQLISLNTWLACRANLTIQDPRWAAAEVL